MARLSPFVALWATIALTSQVLASPTRVRHEYPSRVKRACSSTQTAMPWDQLSSDEKSSYLNAELCLIQHDKITDNEGSQNLWDDIHYNHIWQSNYVHSNGQALPWHRYFVMVHAQLLSAYCSYTGPLPYWDELADSSLSDISEATVLQADAFGGDGSSSDNCLSDGAFANVTLHWTGNGTTGNTCITRDLNLAGIQMASKTNTNACYAETNYVDAYQCYLLNPHGAGHSAAGGTMSGVMLSPGDPLFFLHHTWLDAMWWQWQQQDSGRLTEMGGNNTMSKSDLDQLGWEPASPRLSDYSGDDGSTTTLNHVLYMSGLADNATVGDVMDITAAPICMTYVYATNQE